MTATTALAHVPRRHGQMLTRNELLELRRIPHQSQRLIIEAKYYSQSMQTGRWGKTTIHSANLYQLLTYTKNADVDRDGSVSGLLLYARTGTPTQPDLDIVIQDNRIGARTLDLNKPWSDLTAELEDTIRWLQD